MQTDRSIDVLATVSIDKAKELIINSEKIRTRREKANRKRFARLFKDPNAIAATIMLTDEVMRITSKSDAIRIFRNAVKKASIKGFGLTNGLGLKFLNLISYLAPKSVIKLVNIRVRSLSKDLILHAEHIPLAKHILKRKSAGLSLNINVLGEAVLGHHEADERLVRILEMIDRSEVEYVSVKLSAVVAQMNTIDFGGNLERVCEKLRVIYRRALEKNVFVNLDMEEYRDLELTVAAFKRVLIEPEFENLNAGIVLQAYLPESHVAFEELITWAKNRTGKIKIRLVKGANLAMEHAEAELHGYVAAPYTSKAAVDASYARLIDLALRHENAAKVRIGIASHNLFHLTWAIEVAKMRGVLEQIDIEMLEGMANAEAKAMTSMGLKVILYTPVTKQDDFESAVAYLVRRLDENTSPENYLRASFEINKNNKSFQAQQERFLKSLEDRHEVSTISYRHANPASKHNGGSCFINASDGDPTNPAYLSKVNSAIKEIVTKSFEIPLIIDGAEKFTDEIETGIDPGSEGEVWYTYCVADKSEVEESINAAKLGVDIWNQVSPSDRAIILKRVADLMEDQRPETIAMMSRDAGKSVSESDPEISEAIDFARYYAGKIVEDTNSKAMGIVLVVPPWNFPYSIPAGGVFASLAAGNSVILKPAPETVATAWLLAQQLWAGGVPTSALQFLPTRDDEIGKSLITHDDISAVILTGAFDTARMFLNWKNELNLLAETSGKNSIVITASADIDLAVKDLVHSAFSNAGQKCSAASLGIVLKPIYENAAFQKQLIDSVTSLSVGAGWDYGTTVGPVIRQPLNALKNALLNLDEGESWLVEPKQLDESGYLWSPGVKTGIKPSSWSHKNEWFGPVLGIMVAPDLDTAITWQNETDFGLTAGIHSLNTAECEYWMNQVHAGNLYINRGITGAIVQRQPFGGWKSSSVGATAKAGGANYVNTLRHWQSVVSVAAAKWSVDEWWNKVGSQAIDISDLRVERNYQRYRRPLHPIIVRVDQSTEKSEIELIRYIEKVAGIEIEFSTPETETLDRLVTRAKGKVRWLSSELPPKAELINKGVSVDPRAVAQRGDIEIPRWLLEQSVSITNHRYGNVNAGPKPICTGL